MSQNAGTGSHSLCTMTPKLNPFRLPLRLAAFALLAEVAHLGWEHLHGGILTHHLMRRADLPGLYNGWGLLLLPALAAWAGWRIQKRLTAGARPAAVMAGGLLTLLVGLALSGAFATGQQDLAGGVFMGLLLLALLWPAYRAECWLGLVLGMGFIFGAVIPTLLGGIIAGLSALIHLALRPAVVQGWAALRRD